MNKVRNLQALLKTLKIKKNEFVAFEMDGENYRLFADGEVRREVLCPHWASAIDYPIVSGIVWSQKLMMTIIEGE